MTDKIYILRHITYEYGDDWYYPAEPGRVYKKYDNLKEAQEDKDKLEVKSFKNGFFNKTGYRGLNLLEMYHYALKHFDTDILLMLKEKDIREKINKFYKKGPSQDSKCSFDDQCVERYQGSQDISFDRGQGTIMDYIRSNFETLLKIYGDEHILYYIRQLDLNSYVLTERKMDTKFYKFSFNPKFKDYDENRVWDFEVSEEEVFDETDSEIKWQRITHVFACHLSDYDGDLNCLKGSLTELSFAPDLLDAYIHQHSKLIYYDPQNQILHFQNYDVGLFNLKEHYIIKGLISLLRPHKFPITIQEIPILEIEETNEIDEMEALKHKRHSDDELPF